MKAPSDYVSDTPTDYAVDCLGDAYGPEHACGRTYLTAKGWDHQLSFPNARWKCLVCGGNAWPWCKEKGDVADCSCGGEVLERPDGSGLCADCGREY